MPEQTEAREPRVTGEEILTELLRNMEEGLFPIRFTILVPSVYRIYLHQSDYDPLASAIPFLVTEMKEALNQKLAEWNRAHPLANVLEKIGASTKPKREYKMLGEDWTVEFLPDVESRLQRGEIEIYSELGAPARTEYGVGAMTQRITRRDVDGSVSSREAAPAPVREPAPVAPPPSEQTGMLPLQPDPAATDPLPDQDATRRANETVFAVLRYEDRNGPQVFSVKKNQIVIGRGGQAYWVDLKLNTLPDVSREHCRLRRDPVTGQFKIKDMSQFGTTINGDRVPSSVDRSAGSDRDLNIEVPLPSGARIGLADCVFLEFEIVGGKYSA